MKDFAKSIKVGNADEVIHRDGDFKIKYNEKEKSYELYFNSIYYDTFHTKQQALDKIELYKRRKEARTGNSKVGNGITKFGLGTYVIADGHKAIVLGETVEQGPNGIPFGWVTIRWVEGPWKGQSDQQYDYDLKKA